MRDPHKQKGFSLVEVLVTLVITTIALLSSISLQLMSKRSIYDAAQRTTAAHMAHDLVHRMRSNPDALINYLAAEIVPGQFGAAPGTNCLAAGADCDAVTMAAFDLWQWQQHLDGELETNAGGEATGGLNSAIACITGPAGGGSGNYTVAVAWRGMADVGNPVANNCGAGNGAGNYGDNDEFRRVLVVQSYIAQR